jgi:hypothetical protein
VGLFGRTTESVAERSVRPTRTITGKAVVVPEEIGQLERRARLMAAALRVVQEHPLAASARCRMPLGDGHGMEDVVAVVRPIFASERSLTRWVAIRGALLFLDMVCSQDLPWKDLMSAMGLRIAPDPFTGESRTEVVQTTEVIPPAVQKNIIGVFASLANHLQDYERVSNMTMERVNTDPMWIRVNEAIALDYIAWVAVALSRTQTGRQLWELPEPGLLEYPGWYADPLWAKAERFWDGQDWTARVRVRDGRRWTEATQALS